MEWEIHRLDNTINRRAHGLKPQLPGLVLHEMEGQTYRPWRPLVDLSALVLPGYSAHVFAIQAFLERLDGFSARFVPTSIGSGTGALPIQRTQAAFVRIFDRR